MKKFYISAVLLSTLAVLPATAQDIYKIEHFSSTDLNGDARYIGMGGAMSALGANLSAISTNPASSGLYRKSDYSASVSLLHQWFAEHRANAKREQFVSITVDATIGTKWKWMA